MTETKSPEEKSREETESQRLIKNRKKRFIELLGEDCEYIDAFVIDTDISPWDVKVLLDKGCSKKLILEILL